MSNFLFDCWSSKTNDLFYSFPAGFSFSSSWFVVKMTLLSGRKEKICFPLKSSGSPLTVLLYLLKIKIKLKITIHIVFKRLLYLLRFWKKEKESKARLRHDVWLTNWLTDQTKRYIFLIGFFIPFTSHTSRINICLVYRDSIFSLSHHHQEEQIMLVLIDWETFLMMLLFISRPSFPLIILSLGGSNGSRNYVFDLRVNESMTCI